MAPSSAFEPRAPGERTTPRSIRISLYKRFLYLDSEQAVNALACMDGGDIEERTEKILRELGGDFGVNFTIGAAKIQLGGKGRKTVEEEVRRKRTAHSAIGELLIRLRNEDLLRALNRLEDAIPDENDLVEFSGNIELWPPGPWPIEHPVSGIGPTLTRLVRGEDATAFRRRELGLPRQFTARMPIGSTGRMAIMPMHWQYVVARDPSELARRVTVVGQVEVVPSQDERLGVAYLAADRSCGVVVAGTDSDRPVKDLLAWVPAHRGEWVLIRPLCIFK